MKKFLLILLGGTALAGAALGLTGCAGGSVGVGFDGGYYDGGPWAYGQPYYHGGGWDHAHFGRRYRGGWHR